MAMRTALAEVGGGRSGVARVAVASRRARPDGAERRGDHERSWREASLFIAASGLFLASYLGIASGLSLATLSDDAARWDVAWEATPWDGTQTALLAGALFLVPALLMYAAWSYGPLRGRIRAAGVDRR